MAFITNSQENGKTYTIQSALGGKYLDVKNANPERRAPLHLWMGNGGIAQKFTLKDAGEGYFYIQSNTRNKRAIHVDGANKNPKAKVNLWDVVNQDNLKWKFENAGNGYYFIKSKLGTYLDVQWGKPESGTPIWMWNFNGGDAQKWKLKLSSSITDFKMTSFNPSKDGFQFRNKFKSTIGDVGSVKLTLDGLCGGMAYAANDYFLSSIKIPYQKYQPAIGTKLHDYIYERQQNSLSNLDKFAEYSVNPFGWRDSEFFYWGLEGRLYDLKKSIDNNIPVPLGLFNVHNNPTAHHQVLAIGYDLGGYTGKKENDPNKENVRIFIYDPNNPNKVCALAPFAGESAYDMYIGKIINRNFIKTGTSSKKWRSYFLDNRYKKRNPPNIIKPKLSESKKINRLLVTIKTGGDDLRGGNDNVHLHIYFNDGTSQTLLNANKRQRWPDNNDQTFEVFLDKPVLLDQIKNIKLQTTFGGGFGGDNWNMDCLKVIAFRGNGDSVEIYNKLGKPLKRFTGDHQWFAIK